MLVPCAFVPCCDVVHDGVVVGAQKREAALAWGPCDAESIVRRWMGSVGVAAWARRRGAVVGWIVGVEAGEGLVGGGAGDHGAMADGLGGSGAVDVGRIVTGPGRRRVPARGR